MYSKATLASFFALCGCAVVVDPRPDYENARGEIRAATGQDNVYDPGSAALEPAEIEAMLADGLGLEEAMRLALRNNRRLQAGFMALGVARAEFVQAGLLKNPSLGMGLLFPEGGGRPKWSSELAAGLTEIWQLPLRREIAQAGVETQILDLSRVAGELLFAVQTIYFESVAAREEKGLAQESLQLSQRSLAAVRRQVEGGVATKVEENLAQNLALSAELAAQRTLRREGESLRRLAALLSLESDLLEIPLNDSIPEPGSHAEDREALAARGSQTRADLRAAKRAVEAAQRRLDLEKRRRFPAIDAGLGAERPEGGSAVDFLFGPFASVEIPVFDRNQAQIAKASFELAELQKQEEALRIEAAHEIRSAADKATVAAKAAAFAKGELLPHAQRNAALAGKAYELGDATVLTLLEAQKAELEARRTEIEARLEAARSWVDLERAVGASLAPNR